jgi:DNA-binding MarR family transcriptional regulator
MTGLRYVGVDKWKKLRKVARNELILRYRREHPFAPLSEIAAIFAITKQRVSAIIKRYGKEARNGT